MRSAGYHSGIIKMSSVEGGPEDINVGIRLDGAGCAEHEQGIEYLQNLLNIHPYSLKRPLGIDGWVMGKAANPAMGEAVNPAYALWFDDGTQCGLVVGSDVRYLFQSNVKTVVQAMMADGTKMDVDERGIPPVGSVILCMNKVPPVRHIEDAFTSRMDFVDGNGKRSYRKPRNKSENARLIKETAGIRGAWDQGGFAIVARGDEAAAMVQGLRDALLGGRLAVGIGGGGSPFSRAGISIMDRQLLPEHFVEETRTSDREHRELMAAFKDTGIEETLKAAGKRYYGLKPAWVTPTQSNGLEGLIGDKEQLVFFLNPQEQQRYGFGWYTLHELEQWSRNEGIITAGRQDRDDHQDYYERLREQLDPEGYRQAVDAATAAGLDMSWENVKQHAFALRPFIVEDGHECILWLNPKDQMKYRMGWFTADEVASWIAGEPGPADLSEEEQSVRKSSHHAMEKQERPMEDAMAALRHGSVPMPR